MPLSGLISLRKRRSERENLVSVRLSFRFQMLRLRWIQVNLLDLITRSCQFAERKLVYGKLLCVLSWCRTRIPFEFSLAGHLRWCWVDTTRASIWCDTSFAVV